MFSPGNMSARLLAKKSLAWQLQTELGKNHFSPSKQLALGLSNHSPSNIPESNVMNKTDDNK